MDTHAGERIDGALKLSTAVTDVGAKAKQSCLGGHARTVSTRRWGR